MANLCADEVDAESAMDGACGADEECEGWNIGVEIATAAAEEDDMDDE